MVHYHICFHGVARRGSELDFAAEIQDRSSRQANPLPASLHDQRAAPLRDLSRTQNLFPQPLAPVESKSAVRRTGHGVFGNSVTRSEIPRDHINLAAWSSDAHASWMQALQQGEVGPRVANILFLLVDDEIIPVGRRLSALQHDAWRRGESLEQLRR